MATQVAPQKLSGAFYTPPEVARCLVTWAVRDKNDALLDPSFGEGVFLEQSLRRIQELGGDGASQTYGVEIDKRALHWASERLGLFNVVHKDFFRIDRKVLPSFDAVVGNPPFIRYHHFSGAIREQALACARRSGVVLSELASSWAPFLIHAMDFLSEGGRLAMVLPAELLHASYARPVVSFLFERFAHLSVALFDKRLFPDLSQDTLLLFADDYGGHCSDLGVARFKDIPDLEQKLENIGTRGTRVSASEIKESNGRIRNHVLDPQVSGLYKFFCADERLTRMGELASVGIGYVTGCNAYFQLTAEEAQSLAIPDKYLCRALTSQRSVAGLAFTDEDWETANVKQEKVYLLDLPRVPQSKLPDSIQSYIRKGRRQAIHRAHKCSVRKPWYAVPHTEPADGFFSYMAGSAPSMCWNSAGVLASNSIHEVRFSRTTIQEPWKIALAFLCSLSQLSCEIEGHPMGGGMLKLEPSEAARVLIVRPERISIEWSYFQELDRLLRTKSSGSATDLADDLVLAQGLGLSWSQIQVLRDGLQKIRDSRRKKVEPKSKTISS
jgi:adenine-specific DNA methylase